MFLYDENETMEMIGKQNYSDLESQEVKSIFDVLDAYKRHNKCETTQMAFDLYFLGYIFGKRAERNRYADKGFKV